VICIFNTPETGPFVVSWDAVFVGGVPIGVFFCLVKQIPILFPVFCDEEFNCVPLLLAWVKEVISSLGMIELVWLIVSNCVPDVYREIVELSSVNAFGVFA
jgi:hypothetical protein